MLHALSLLMIALLVAVSLYPLANKLRLPFSLLLVLAGMAAASIIDYFNFDIGLRWFHVHTIAITVLLPPLVFESALHMPWQQLKKGRA